MTSYDMICNAILYDTECIVNDYALWTAVICDHP